MITIVNYGLGNIKALTNIFEQLNIDVNIANNNNELLSAKKLILPGVGSFDWAINKLNNSGMRNNLEKMVLKYNIPILGICVGMQMMANDSEEGILEGLGWIDGSVKKFEFKEDSSYLPLPHMGWNVVAHNSKSELFKDLNEKRFYFLHSYFFEPKFICNSLSKTEYGRSFTSSINKCNIYGVQFHPEKSHLNGMNLLSNFHNIK